MLHWNLDSEPCFHFDALLSSLLIPNHSGHYDTVQMILIFTPIPFESVCQDKNPLARQTREKEGGKGRRIPPSRAAMRGAPSNYAGPKEAEMPTPKPPCHHVGALCSIFLCNFSLCALTSNFNNQSTSEFFFFNSYFLIQASASLALLDFPLAEFNRLSRANTT